jgi:hypothetical protein
MDEGIMRCREANATFVQDQALVCGRCGAALHADCGRALGRCPTLGCGAPLFRERPFGGPGSFHEALSDLEELGRLAILSTLAALVTLGAIALVPAICWTLS